MPSIFWDNILASVVALLILLAVAGVFIMIINWVRVSRQKSYYESVHSKLKPGSRVMFSYGMFRKLVRVDEKTCDIEVKSGAVIEVSLHAIQQVLE